MNPVDLIRELAEALETHEAEAYQNEYFLSDKYVEFAPSPLLTRAQAFLAAQPVVVELDATIDRNIVEIRTNAYDTPAYLALGPRKHAHGPCTVHVVVIPGVK